MTLKKGPEPEEGLSLKDQKWMAYKLGINLEETGLELGSEQFIDKMRAMLAGSIKVDGKELNYDILAKDMVEAQIGIGMIDLKARTSTESMVANLAHGLMHMFLTDYVIHDVMKPKGQLED